MMPSVTTAASPGDPLAVEAAAVGRYLAGRPVHERFVRLYADGVRRGIAPLDERERRLLGRAVRHPWLLGFVDAAEALRNPRGGLRRRMLLMFALLEASPEHCDLFLPRPTPRLRALGVAWAAVRAAAKAALGLVLSALLR